MCNYICVRSKEEGRRKGVKYCKVPALFLFRTLEHPFVSVGSGFRNRLDFSLYIYMFGGDLEFWGYIGRRMKVEEGWMVKGLDMLVF